MAGPAGVEPVRQTDAFDRLSRFADARQAQPHRAVPDGDGAYLPSGTAAAAQPMRPDYLRALGAERRLTIVLDDGTQLSGFVTRHVTSAARALHAEQARRVRVGRR